MGHVRHDLGDCSVVRTVFGSHISLVYPGEEESSSGQLIHADQVLSTEWSSLPRVFDEIYEVFSHSHVDLFATRANTKLPIYIYVVLDPMAWKQDNFQYPQDGMTAYAFPSLLCFFRSC